MPFFTPGELKTEEPDKNAALTATLDRLCNDTQENGHGILQLAIELKLIAEHLGANEDGK